MTHKHKHTYISGFTIVELLIVIVVIGILAAITTFAYNGITDRAKVAVTKSDLANSYKQLLAKVNTDPTGSYPADLTAAGLTSSAGVAYQYTVNNSTTPKTFCLTATNGSTVNYFISNAASSPQDGLCTGHVAAGTPTCATGYVLVPGSSTYGTSDFCVMKYEAKNDGSGNAVSVAAGTAWASIAQTAAITASNAACTGCRLISEAEWLTIASNVIAVGSNWSSGTVGTGYIYSGHVDTSPNNLIAASTSDTDNYFAMTSPAANQRRTLTLSNGSVVWDMSGNAWEYTTGAVAGNQQPGLVGDGSNAWKEYNNPSMVWRSFPANARPGGVNPAGTNWSSAQGIGEIATNYNQSAARVYGRGGGVGSLETGGILSLSMANIAASPSGTGTGFRVTRNPL